MQFQFLLLLSVLIPILILSADDSKPWYRSKSQHEQILKKEAEKKKTIEYHQYRIRSGKKEIEYINREHNLHKEEVREIPLGSSKRIELKEKLNEIREVRGNIKRQKLLSNILQKHNQEFSDVLNRNVAVNSPLKNQKVKEEMEAIKAKNIIIPKIHDKQNEEYSLRDRGFTLNRWAYESVVRDHEKELEEIQNDQKKKGKWKSFLDFGKRE